MKKTLSMILVLTLALALMVSSLSALAAAPVIAFSSEEPDANPQGENTPGGDGGSDTGGGTGGSSGTYIIHNFLYFAMGFFLAFSGRKQVNPEFSLKILLLIFFWKLQHFVIYRHF